MVLLKSLNRIKSLTGLSRFNGNIDVFNPYEISGWFVDRKNDSPVSVIIYFNRKHLVSFEANKSRPDVKKAGLGPTRCGFNHKSKERLFTDITDRSLLNKFTLTLNGKRLPLTLFLGKDAYQPKKESTPTKRASGKEAIFFYPDYTSNNHYQKELYSQYPNNCEINAGSLVEAYRYLRANKDQKVTFHLHWIKPILDVHNVQEVEANANSFITLLERFQEIGGRFFWTVHNKFSHDIENEAVLSKEITFRSRLATMADIIHLHSKTAIPAIEEYYPLPKNRVRIIPHGNYVGIYPNQTTKEDARKKLDIGQDALVFSFVGQLRPYKGIEELIIAFSTLESKKKVHLMLAGKPVLPYKPGDVSQTASLIDGAIVEERFIPDDELQIFMNASDFVVTPYKDILTSGSVLNALSFGKPVIAPHIGMIPEVVTPESGILYDTEEEDALKHALEKAARLDKPSIQKLGANAKTIIDKYNWKEISKAAYHQFHKEDSYKTRSKKLESETVQYQVHENIRNAKKKDSVAVVILNYENTTDSKALVKSLKDSTWKAFDTFLVDNASPHETMHGLLKKFDDVSVIRSLKNLGYAGGNNLGALLAKEFGYDFIWILNPDTVVPIDTMSNLLEKARNYPEISIHGTVLLNGNNPAQVLFAGGLILTTNAVKTKILHSGSSIDELPDEIIETDYVNGASMFFKSELIGSNSLIPEEYFLYYEETDWCYGLKKQGKKLAIHPDTFVMHNKRSEHNGLPATYYLYYFIRSTLLFTKKHKPELTDSTLESLHESFISPWLDKIEQRNPHYLPIAQTIMERAIKDGLNNSNGPVDLNQVIFNNKELPLIKSAGEGYLDKIVGGTVYGWAVDPTEPWSPCRVTIFIDGIPAGETVASQHRKDLEEQGILGGTAGFEFTVPQQFCDGNEHTIGLAFSRNGKEFGIPTNVTLSAHKPDYRAFIEKPGDFQITGWAWDKNHPEKTLSLEVLCDGDVIDTVLANQYRPDLEKAGIKSGDCAFTAQLPVEYARGGRRVFTLRIINGPEIARKEISWSPRAKSIYFNDFGIGNYINWSYLNSHIPANASGNTFEKAQDILQNGANALKAKYKTRDQNDLISIIMPAYNRKHVIDDAIYSVINQAYANWELIVVDDGSDDNLFGHLQETYSEYLQNEKISYIRFEFNRGVSHARNAGLSAAKGKYIAYLDSDNTWDEGYLLVMRNALVGHTKFSVAYCGQEVLSYRTVNGERISYRTMVRGSAFNPALVENQNYIDLNVFFHSKSLYNQLGGFNHFMKRLVDWELILRYTFQNKPLFVPAILNAYSFGKTANQITAIESFGKSHFSLRNSFSAVLKKRAAVRKTNTKVDLLLILRKEPDNEILKVLLALKTYANNYNIVIVGNPESKQYEKATTIFRGKQNVSLQTLQPTIEDDESYEGTAIEIGLRKVRKNAHLVLLSDQALLDQFSIPAFLNEVKQNPDIGIASSRRTVKTTESEYHKFRKYARGDADYDLMAEMLDEHISNIALHSAQNTIYVTRSLFFCNFINKKIVPIMREMELKNHTAQKMLDNLVNASYIAENMVTAYLPDVRVFDRSYLS